MGVSNLASSFAGGANGAAASGGIIGQIEANANQSLAIAGAQSDASLKQAAGEALKGGAKGIKDAASPS